VRFWWRSPLVEERVELIRKEFEETGLFFNLSLLIKS
jgi:hypothetical protein